MTSTKRCFDALPASLLSTSPPLKRALFNTPPSLRSRAQYDFDSEDENDVTPVGGGAGALSLIVPKNSAFNEKSNVRYDFVELLGIGAHSKVFLATAGDKNVVLKRFERKPKLIPVDDADDEEDFVARVTNEFHLNRFAYERAQATDESCSYFISPIAMFFEKCDEPCVTHLQFAVDDVAPRRIVQYGNIVFPSTNGVSLALFCERVLYQYRYSQHPVAYWTCALWIAEELSRAVSILTHNGVYHRDIKMENVLIERIDGGDPLEPDAVEKELRVRVVDFGLATTSKKSRVREYEVAHGLETRSLEDYYESDVNPNSDVCSYVTTVLARDPRSFDQSLIGEDVLMRQESMIYLCAEVQALAFPRDKVDVFFPLFELFAVATVVQLLFDPNRNCKPFICYITHVRRTSLMPTGGVPSLVTTLKQMSGALIERKTALEYSIYFRNLRVFLKQVRRPTRPPPPRPASNKTPPMPPTPPSARIVFDTIKKALHSRVSVVKTSTPQSDSSEKCRSLPTTPEMKDYGNMHSSST